MKKTNTKILLIDDNPKNLQIAMNILDKEGYHLIYAKNGIKGIELALNGNFDLILLDVVMPQMDGYEVCQILKKDETTKYIPIIFLTIKDEERDIVEGFKHGGVDYVTKPFYTEVLLQRVKTHIKLSQITKELKELNETLEERVEQQIEKIRFKDQILFQQSKMASMGEMIANIAHQWNQPLSAISTISLAIKTKFALNKFETNTEECETYINNKLNDVECYILSLSQTIDDFRNFFKPQKETTKFYISDIIQKSIRLIDANLKNSDIKIINKTEESELIGFENELSQVLINILNNARDALIKQKSHQKIIFISTTQNNNYISITIKDNAKGIKEEHINKIFEPYFTTKQQTNGTGIGLYMSKEIIEKHMQGSIIAKNITYTHENIEYSGAEFTIKIPTILEQSE